MNKNSTMWWGIGILALVIALLVSGRFLSKGAGSTLSSREVALNCTTDMATQFHIHTSLTIVINGKEQKLPSGIGIKPGCMNALHTHEADGEIHVESPLKRDFTLGDFFAVWDKPFSKDQILDFKTDGKNAIRVQVNGSDVDTFENTILRDKDRIVINYGPAV